MYITETRHQQDQEKPLDEQNFFIGAIFYITNEVKNNKEESHSIPTGLKIDSGDLVNVIPEYQIETLQTKRRITKSTTTLSAYSRSNIPVK